MKAGLRRFVMSGAAAAGIDRDDLLYGKRPRAADYDRAVAPGATGNTIIREMLRTRRPCLIGRLGANEALIAAFFRRWRAPIAWPGLRPGYPRGAVSRFGANAGFFPLDASSLDRFSATYLDALTRADALGVWGLRQEHVLVRSCADARLLELSSLDPILHEEPWSAELAGRRVLVVHPFAQSIERQYNERRALLFRNPDTLPVFELRTIRAVQSIAGNRGGFESWFDALEAMCQQIERVDYDIAIIGAGAYGLPIAAFVKAQGKQAVHVGGAAQLLFGIKGRRWEDQPRYSALINDHWIRPSADETPPGHERVEGSAYW